MTEAITKPRTYIFVFTALIGLTGATVALSHVDLGVWHGPVGLGIAGAKAVLIVLFFMHLMRSSRLIWLVALAGLFWLGLLLALTLADVLSRDWPM